MIENPDRWHPITSMVISIIFPGYFYWKENRKVESLSLSFAVILGYLLVIGVLIHLFCLYQNWRKSQKHNKTWGYTQLTETEKRNLSIMGTIGGALAHPIYQVTVAYWLISLGYITNINDSLQFQIFPLVFLLILVYCLRFFLYYSIQSVTGSEKSPPMLPIYKEFSRNNSPLILLIPSYFLMVFPFSQLTITIYLFIVLPLGLILGSRVLFSHYKILSTD